MTPLQLQGIDASPAAPTARRATGATDTPGGFASLLQELEHAGRAPTTPEQLGSTLATADDAFELAMRLRVELEQAYSRRQL